ncbi:hypothetical protein FEW53_002348 [Enterococcus faecalis]|nr:hypothetical protein [Enterococcus faecalis]
MKIIENQFIGHDNEILMVYHEGISICINNLKNYCNQLYRQFNSREEAQQFYLALIQLKSQN